MMVTHSSN